MSRIDQALRLAGEWRQTVNERNGIFQSPWPQTEQPVEAVKPANEPVVSFRRQEQPPIAARLPLSFDRLSDETRVRLPIGPYCDERLSHQFRRLAATLIHTAGTEILKSVMITSAAPGDGKTLTALNLALILSESFGRRVLLVEADLRRPTLARLLNINVRDGLSEALRSPDDRFPTLIPLTERLMLLPAGRPNPDPLSGLTSSKMEQLLESAYAQYDWVIVDTPPVTAAADAGLLCPLVDAAILVVRAKKTILDGIKQAVETLGHDRILGVVLNASESDGVPYDVYPTYSS